MGRVAIIQSNYIPWKGYFDIINSVDDFVIYDDIQYTKNDWRNRNIIKTHNGPIWLTIPVINRGYQLIYEVEAANDYWRRKHFNSIKQNYVRSPFYQQFEPIFEILYLQSSERNLHKINMDFILAINNILGIETSIHDSREFELVEGKTERLVDLCIQLGADEYLSGPSARNYINVGLFNQESIDIKWMDYSNYPTYKQLYGPFIHEVSILDLLFNAGPDSIKYLKSKK